METKLQCIGFTENVQFSVAKSTYIAIYEFTYTYSDQTSRTWRTTYSLKIGAECYGTKQHTI